MGLGRTLKSLFVKQLRYEGQVVLPYNIATVYQTIPTIYGGLTGFCGSQTKNLSNGFNATLAYQDKNGMAAEYTLIRAAENQTKVVIKTVFPSGNASVLFEDIVDALKKKLKA